MTVCDSDKARIAQLERELAEALEAATTDPLTGLGNRAALDAAGECAAYVAIDANKFKQVNDTHGHAAGDVVLVEIADVLRTLTRPGDSLIRQGGDEFIVGLHRENQADSLVERLRSARFSYGVSLSVGAGATIEIADKNAYAHKKGL